VLSYTAKNTLPAARLAQIAPSRLPGEVERLAAIKGISYAGKEKEKELDEDGDEVDHVKAHEKLLKSPNASTSTAMQWGFSIASIGMIFLGWIMFGLGVGWGVHGSVVAGTVGE
jgi:hypothetical protein